MFDAADFALFGAALPPIAREFELGPAQAGFLATVGIFALFTGLVAASWSVLSLSIFRFLSNFGLGGEVPVTSTLSAEFSPGEVRGRRTGCIMASFPLGLVVAALLSLSIIPHFGWRAPFVVGVVPALLLLLFVRAYMPESVRFLLSKGRVAEAEATVAKIEHQALGRNLTAAEIKALPKLPNEAVVETKVTVG
jgi:putative MFS transporter